ncbi:hypothetical protein DLAC_07417 [Tieghemostelium lacteum]|uniref:Uncharacterized protein n=1 Tax=Tieghemostelium lacteum TaxID=361077 RepID=A0A151ZCG6_TIELA|nr:hypothetical protein DLAC_07417 [Tieghemostelium lacteum]|eukprot:KYQ91642.1 hypothetical protein DLAC_07417 [Tieghemostelium lacteum]
MNEKIKNRLIFSQLPIHKFQQLSDIDAQNLSDYLPKRFNRLVFSFVEEFPLFLKYISKKIQIQNVVVFHSNFVKVPVGTFLEGLRSVDFGILQSLDSLEPGSLPESVEIITFRNLFTSPLKWLPSSLETLIFLNDYKYQFTKELFSNCPNFKRLEVKYQFNSKISPGVLPPSLEILKLSESYSHDILPGTLPSSLKKLKVFFYENLQLHLPSNSIDKFKLILTRELKSPLCDSIAKKLTHLVLYEKSVNYQPGCNPKGLKSVSYRNLTLESQFSLKSKPGSIPEGVEVLKNFVNSGPLSIDMLPNTITTLKFSNYYSTPIEPGVLPKSLKTLILSSNFRDKIEMGSLPMYLTTLDLGGFNEELPVGLLPQSLKNLKFGGFDKPIQPGSLPNSIEVLLMGNAFTKKLQPNTLPTSLRYLEFGNHFNKKFLPNVLPQQLRSLTLGNNYIKPLIHLPPSLQSLKAGFHTGHIIPKDCKFTEINFSLLGLIR